MKHLVRAIAGAVALACGGLASPAAAWEMVGTHPLVLHARDGSRVTIGTVQFHPQGDGRFGFALKLDHARFNDHFLSMREFKCLESPDEVFCHVPYPYPRPDTVTTQDLAWLEHALLFLYKLPREFGAKLWNGVIFKLRVTEQGLVGTPQAVDLNLIGAPPVRTDVPPYRPALRDDIRLGARWFEKLTVE